MTTNTKYNFIICMDPVIVDGKLNYKKQFIIPLILPVENEDKTKAILINTKRALQNILLADREPNTYIRCTRQYLKTVNIITTEKVYTDMKITKPFDINIILKYDYADYHIRNFIIKNLERNGIYIY